MRPEEELATRARKLAEGYIQILNDLREIRRMICPETDDHLVQMCNKQWQKYQGKAT